MLTAKEVQDVLDTFEDADVSIIESILYFDGWSTYEEYGGYLVFRGIDGSIQYCKYGYCVMASDNTNYFRPRDVSEDEWHAMVASVEEAKASM